MKDQKQSFGVVGGRPGGRREDDKGHSDALDESISRFAGVDPSLQTETPLEAAQRQYIEANTAIALDRCRAEVLWLDVQSDRVAEETSQSRILFLFSVVLGVLFAGCLVLGVIANPQFLAGSWITSPVLIASIFGSLFRRPRGVPRDDPR